AALDRCRHVLQQAVARLARDRDDAQLAGREVALETRVIVEPHVDVAAQQRRHEIRRGAERDDGYLDTGELLEQVRRQILRAAGIDGAEVELAGILAGGVDDVLERAVGRVAGDRDQYRKRRRDRDRREVL